MNCAVEITQKWGNTVVSTLICWKIIFDLEIELWPWIYPIMQSGQEWQDVVRQILNTYILTINNQQYENVTPQNEV